MINSKFVKLHMHANNRIFLTIIAIIPMNLSHSHCSNYCMYGKKKKMEFSTHTFFMELIRKIFCNGMYILLNLLFILSRNKIVFLVWWLQHKSKIKSINSSVYDGRKTWKEKTKVISTNQKTSTEINWSGNLDYSMKLLD